MLKHSDLPDGQLWVSHDGDYFDSFLPTIADWIQACQDRRPPVMSGEQGLVDLRVAMAMYESLETGSTVALGLAQRGTISVE